MKDFYIYNIAQAQYFLDCGLSPIAVGRGKKGDFFLRFTRDEKSEVVFSKWCNYLKRVAE